jgi:hypothetical protein
MIIFMTYSVAILSAVFALVLAVVMVIHLMEAISYWTTVALPYCAGCWAIPFAIYYTAAAAVVVLAIAAAAELFTTPVDGIPCFVWEQRTEHPLQVEVTRTTSPSSINYGVYTTDWPVKKQSASGVVKDGSIFPPNQNFDIIPDF